MRQGLLASDMHDDIKRRLLREVVQDNLATTPCPVGPSPAPVRMRRRRRMAVRTVLCLVVVLILLPRDDMSTVISTVIEQRVEEFRSPFVSTPHPDALEPADESPLVTEPRVAALEPADESPLVAEPRVAALEPADESPLVAEPRVAALEPRVEAPPPASEELLPPSEEVESPEHILTAPVPIDLAVIPLRVKKIVLDPGHGGKDVGASIPMGLTEKEMTLDIGLRLRRLLEQATFEVFMTRDKDETMPLAQRTALANAKGADLFVSIHINWIDRSHARGMETYYLGPTEEPLLLQLAAQENRDSGYSLADFRRLLDGIYLSVRRDESRRLAATVQRTLVKSLHPKNPAMVNRGVKTAPFAVLVGTEMPAILAEVACLSNAEEAQLLATPQYRQDIAQALFQGIRAYAQTLNRFPKIRKLTHE